VVVQPRAGLDVGLCRFALFISFSASAQRRGTCLPAYNGHEFRYIDCAGLLVLAFGGGRPLLFRHVSTDRVDDLVYTSCWGSYLFLSSPLTADCFRLSLLVLHAFPATQIARQLIKS
jgi:hypothetical protein